MKTISAPDLEHWARVSFAHKLDEAEATRAWSEQFDAFLLAHRLDLCDLLVRVAKDFYASFCPGCQARIRLAEGELCEYRGEADQARGRYLEAFALLRGLVNKRGRSRHRAAHS